MTIQTIDSPVVDFATVKARQQAAWASGDYAVVGTTLQIVGEMLCEAVDLRGGQRVLDVAAGNGNAKLAAARRFAEVTSTDYVAALLERGRERAEAERLPMTFRQADAEDLPFADGSFDVVLLTFGVMFTPDHAKAARELLRVCRPGGRIGLANWTPDSFIGRVFNSSASTYRPRPASFRRDVGQARASRETVRRRGRGRCGATGLRLPLLLAGAFHRGVPHLLRPGPQGLRRSAARPGARSSATCSPCSTSSTPRATARW